MSRYPPRDEADRVGLCMRCRHARVVAHPRGGPAYYRCGLHDTDPRFPKYPALPVRTCGGFAATGDAP
jgi:hypothetical protein